MISMSDINECDIIEKKENGRVFNDENIEEQFRKAIERGKKSLDKDKHMNPPAFLLPESKNDKDAE